MTQSRKFGSPSDGTEVVPVPESPPPSTDSPSPTRSHSLPSDSFQRTSKQSATNAVASQRCARAHQITHRPADCATWRVYGESGDASWLPLRSSQLPHKKIALHAKILPAGRLGPIAGDGNVDYLLFTRMSLNNRISLDAGNTQTLIESSFLNASHGSIGGTPGYHDSAEGNSYVYTVDREASIDSDQFIRAGLLAEEIDIILIDDDDYGFPMNNPDVIP